MLRGEEIHWICPNRDCGMTVAYDETDCDVETRTCSCGRSMRRESHATVFSYLNFLREEASDEAEGMKEKEETPCEK